MKLFNIVKNGDKYLELKSIPKVDYRAYCLENDECVIDFLNTLKISSLEKNEEFLQARFNPLLRKQSLFLEHQGTYLEIPWRLLKCKEDLANIEKLFNSLESEKLKYILANLLKYSFTKDFIYLNRLVEIDADFNLSIFKYINKAIVDAEGYNSVFLEKAISTLKNEELELEKTLVFGEHLLRKEKSANLRSDIYNKVKCNPQKKNVIVIHLESLSNEIYYKHIDKFPILNGLMDNSLVLTNYFTAASTSATAVMGIFYGNDFDSDPFQFYDHLYLEDTYSRNMFSILQENGYEVLGIGYHEDAGEEINGLNLWPLKNQEYEWFIDFKTFENRLKNFILSAENPFAIHVWNLMPQVAHADEDKLKGANFLERMDISYVSLDMSVGFILDALNEKGILDNTIIIGYGDHGDDRWTRSLNKGLSHIVEPHINVVHTPALIYDSRIGSGYFNDIVSSIDVKSTALFLADVEFAEKFPFHGINIFEKSNDVVFSQNILANQLQDIIINKDWVIRLNGFSRKDRRTKSFTAINENYNILVGDHGVEFFAHELDPWNYCNLLSFFEIDENGTIVKFNHHSAWRGHLRTVLMADDQIYDIIKNYHLLRKALIERLNIRYSLIKTDEINHFDMSLFNKVRSKDYTWGIAPDIKDTISLEKNDYFIPEEWRRFIECASTENKKIILYNTPPVVKLFQRRGNLNRIRVMLDAFRTMNDVITWWCTQPINESVCQFVNKELMDEYKQIVEKYKNKRGCIYDDSQNFQRAAAFADVYIGNKGSVWQLFSSIGKDTLLEYQIAPSFYDCFLAHNNCLFSIPIAGSMIYKIDLLKQTIRYFSSVPNMSISTFYHWKFVKLVGDKVCLIPHSRNTCAIYDFSAGSYESFNLELKEDFMNKDNGTITRNFINAFFYNQKIFFLPSGYDAIVSYDTRTKKTEHCLKLSSLPELSENNHNAFDCVYEFLDNTKILVGLANSNCVIEFNLETYEYKAHHVCEEAGGFISIVYHAGLYWLVDPVGLKIYKWNYSTGEIVMLDGFTDSLFDKTIASYSENMVFKINEFLYCFPSKTNVAVKVSLLTGEITKLNGLDKYTNPEGEDTTICFVNGDTMGNLVYLIHASFVIIEYNVETEEARVLDNISVDC